ncbi:MAG: hypothetical protein U5N85_06965 [Arcicella sp.]|nr:hypothetical protein [Arcicella sp.]
MCRANWSYSPPARSCSKCDGAQHFEAFSQAPQPFDDAGRLTRRHRAAGFAQAREQGARGAFVGLSEQAIKAVGDALRLYHLLDLLDSLAALQRINILKNQRRTQEIDHGAVPSVGRQHFEPGVDHGSGARGGHLPARFVLHEHASALQQGTGAARGEAISSDQGDVSLTLENPVQHLISNGLPERLQTLRGDELQALAGGAPLPQTKRRHVRAKAARQQPAAKQR